MFWTKNQFPIKFLYFHKPMFWSQEPVTTISSLKNAEDVTFSSWNTKLLSSFGFPSMLQFHIRADPSFPVDKRYFWWGCRFKFLHPSKWATNYVYFFSFPLLHSYHTICPFPELQNTLPGKVFQFAVQPSTFRSYSFWNMSVLVTLKFLASMAKIFPPKAVTNKYS